MIVMISSPLARILVNNFNWTISPLKGHIEYADYKAFSWPEWFDGSYQKEYDKYLEDHIGLRNLLVRLHNEIDFQLYRKTATPWIIAGKDDYLYEENYIKAYLGQDFIGHDRIDEKSSTIKAVQDELDSLGIELLIVMAPGKASMFPEYIPDRFLKDSVGISNYAAYRNKFHELGIKFIDFNALFIKMKDTSRLPLYHKCGIHWNIYSSGLALDSIVRYFETVRGVDLTEMTFEGIEMSEIPRGNDYDIGDALNLYSRIQDQPMPYPYGLTFNEEGKDKPNLMVIADSYYWTLYNEPYSHRLWNEHHFRYYDSQLFSKKNPDQAIREISLEELKKFDLVMVLYTEMNLYKLGDSFFDRAYAALFNIQDLEDIKQSIRDNSEWLADVKEKAERHGRTLEEQIDLDAMWVLNKQKENIDQNNEEKE
jgi:hypothetical protein